MSRFVKIVCGAILVFGAPITAAGADPARVFSVAPVADGELAASTGTGSPYQRLTWRQFATLSDFQARNDFRNIGELGRIQMDVWWGTTGSELIAQSVRAGL